MRKRLNRSFSYRLAHAVLCTSMLFSTTVSWTQESAEKTTQKAVQRDEESRAVGSRSPNKPAQFDYETHYVNHPGWFKRHELGIGLGLAIGAPIAGVLIWGRQPSCHHYEYGQNGVGMPCPVEPKPGK